MQERKRDLIKVVYPAPNAPAPRAGDSPIAVVQPNESVVVIQRTENGLLDMAHVKPDENS